MAAAIMVSAISAFVGSAVTLVPADARRHGAVHVPGHWNQYLWPSRSSPTSHRTIQIGLERLKPVDIDKLNRSLRRGDRGASHHSPLILRSNGNWFAADGGGSEGMRRLACCRRQRSWQSRAGRESRHHRRPRRPV